MSNAEAGDFRFTARSIEADVGLAGRSGRRPNPNVATTSNVVRYIEEATGLEVVRSPAGPQRTDIQTLRRIQQERPGHYGIIFNEQHIVYAKIGRNGRLSILDPSIGRGWSSWDSFLNYANANQSLYGPRPTRNHSAYYFR
jgi:hypothetical protein